TLYSGEPPTLSVVPDAAGARVTGWGALPTRAHDVAVTLRPGLLAGSVPGGAGFVGPRGLDEIAILAADEQSRISALSTGPAQTIAERTRRLLAGKQLVVVALPAGNPGRAALRSLIAGRVDGELLLVAHVPATPPERGYSRA